MISALISCREQIFLIRDHIILQLSHRLELHTCNIRKRLACLVQRIADSWPDSLDDTCAREEWGWKPAYNLESMTVDMLEKLREKLK